MEPENPDQNKEVTKNSQINNLNKEQIIDQNNNQIDSGEQTHNQEIEIFENQNMNDNNSDFINNNYNEDVEAMVEEEENNENIEQNMENENEEENNNDRVININNNNLNNDKFEIEGEYNNDPNFNMFYQNKNNENTETNNENENLPKNKQIFNNENVNESVQNYIFELKNKLNSVMNENSKLRMINQKILMGLNDFKNQNISLNQKLKNLHFQNQKLKQMKSDNIEVVNLKNQIQKMEKFIYKLENDKKILESRLGNKQMQSPNQIQNINLLNYKKNQLINSPKNKMPLSQNNNSMNENDLIYKNKILILEKNNKKLSQNNNELENQNKYLQKVNQKMFVDSKNKDKIIIYLKDKMSLFKNEYIEQTNTFQKDNDKTQSLLNQALFEKEQLIKENSDLKNVINQQNYKLKEISMVIQLQKSEFNDKMKKIYDDKLDEYKRKIIILKNRVNELLGVETHGNYIPSRGNSARIRNLVRNKNINTNELTENRSLKYNKNLNILTDFNLYSGNNKAKKDYKNLYSNFNFGTK